MLGWCPNVSITRAREDERFDDTTVNAPDSGGGTYSISRWLNRYSNRILLNSCILTLSAISLFFAYGKDRPDLAMGGVISGLILGLITCVKEWHKFNKVTASEFRSSQMTRIRKFVDYMIIIGPIIVLILVISFSTVRTDIRISYIYAFLSGFILTVWIQYLMVVYWERKNKKTLIFERSSLYAVNRGGNG